jgi:hypothetical protein
LKGENEMVGTPRNTLVSPTREYVLIIEDETFAVKEHIYVITIPDLHESSVAGAREYFLTYIFPNAKIKQCLPYQQYKHKILASFAEQKEKMGDRWWKGESKIDICPNCGTDLIQKYVDIEGHVYTWILRNRDTRGNRSRDEDIPTGQPYCRKCGYVAPLIA